MAKPSIYVANTAETTVETNGVLPLGNIVRRPCNKNIALVGNEIQILDQYSNYYDVVVSVTFNSAEAGDVTLVLEQNGVPVVGATGTQTITTADTETRTISFSPTIRATAGCTIDTLRLVNTGIPATYTNIAVRVIKN